MEQEVTNYARFYALLKKLPGADKETLVYQFTGGRTKSLRQMSDQFTGGRTKSLRQMSGKEYESMCNEMERVAGCDERREAYCRELRRKRSAALHQMQLLGIDTADWDRVNDFCRDPRIAGTEFRRLDRHRRAGGAGREMPRHPPQAARERSQRTTFKLTTL